MDKLSTQGVTSTSIVIITPYCLLIFALTSLASLISAISP
jgi:hypothetical protein